MTRETWLIRGGTVVTMDPARTVRRADVLVRDGRIERVGRLRPPEGAAVLDATDAAVMPGLVQSHVHLCQSLFRGMAEDLPLLRWLRARIWPLEAAHDGRSLYASARLGLAAMMRAGTTAVLDMGTVHDHDAVFEAMRDAGVRGLSGKAMMDRGRGCPARLRESTRESLTQSERLRARWHGAGEGRLGYAYAPRFVLSCSASLLEQTAEAARHHGLLVHSHVAEHASERAAVRRARGAEDLAVLERHGVCGPRAVLAHGVQLGAGELRRAAALGTRLVHCPSANLKLASGIAPLRAMRRAGVRVGLGADGAPCNDRMDLWTEMRLAALLAKVQAADPAAVSAADVLAMATCEGAAVLGLDGEIGSVEPGKRADLLVVRLDALGAAPRADVVTQLVYATTPADVRHVLIDGALRVRDHALVGVDEETIRREAERAARRVRARAGV
ncbi:MAG: amidohydrolase family protein [Myxococcales bacterium]|nr:amidohydrolase family protein [Myxococcales bacterium]